MVTPLSETHDFVVLLKFICNLSLFASVYNVVTWFCRSLIVADHKILSVNNIIKISMSLNDSQGNLKAVSLPCETIPCANSFMNRENSVGLAKYPCVRPCKHSKYSVFSLPWLTHACTVLYMPFSIRSILPWTPFLKCSDHNKDCCTESNA